MTGNDVTTEGARLILQSAVKNKDCQVDIVMDDEYKGDSEVRKMMNVLRDRRRIKANVVSYIE